MLKISKNRKICPCLIMALAENKQEQKNLSLLNFGIFVLLYICTVLIVMSSLIQLFN